MEEQKPFSKRQLIGGFFSMLVFFGLYYRTTAQAERGSYTWYYAMALIAIGTLGALLTFFWPERKGPE